MHSGFSLLTRIEPFRPVDHLLFAVADGRFPPRRVLPARVTAAAEQWWDAKADFESDVPVVNLSDRLRSKIAFWREWSVSKVVLGWIAEGYRLPWKDGPCPPHEARNHAGAQQYAEFVDSAVAEMLREGAIAKATSKPKVVSPLNVVPKKTPGKYRLILDLRFLNKWLHIPRFKFEGLRNLADILRPGDHMVQVDLQSGYYHLGMHPDSWEYMGFEWRGVYYIFKVLPFGLASAPHAFSKLMREFVGCLRSQGLRLLPYLDDFLFAIAERLHQTAAYIRSMFAAAGLQVNEEKSSFDPSQICTHLGFEVDTAAGLFRVPQGRWDNLLDSIDRLLTARHVTVRGLASVAGQVVSMHFALGPVARMMTRGMYRCINDASVGWDCHITLSDEAREELVFWQGVPRERYTAPIWRSAAVAALTVNVDASAYGWGAILGDKVAHEYLTPAQRLESSTWREAYAVHQAITSFLPDLRGREVLVLTDNQNVERILAGGSRKERLHKLATDVFYACMRHNVKLSCQWVPREHNQEADAVSKLVDRDDWKVNPKYFNILDQKWGPHTFDRFASSRNHQLPLFNAIFWCPGVSGVDAFAQSDWPAHNNWLNPPFCQIGRVLRLMREQRCAGTLIAPLWCKQFWWHMLCPDGVHLAPFVVDWVEFGRGQRQDLFLPGFAGGNQMAVGPPAYRVLAIRVDCTPAARVRRRYRCTVAGGCCSNCRRMSRC